MAVINSAVLETSLFDWLVDAKIVLVEVVWLILGLLLILKRTVKLKSVITAYITMFAFVLFLFAIAGTVVFCGSAHDFGRDNVKTIEAGK